MDRQFAEFEAPAEEAPRASTSILTTIGDTSGRIGRGSGDVTRGHDLRPAGRPGRARLLAVRRDARGPRRSSSDYPDYRTSVSDVDPLRSAAAAGDNFAVDVNLVGPDLDVLTDYTYRLIDRLKQGRRAWSTSTRPLSVRKPELQVVTRPRPRGRPGRDGRAGRARPWRSWSAASRSRPSRSGDEQYDVWLRAEAGQRTDRQAIADLTVPTADGRLVPLGSLARMRGAPRARPRSSGSTGSGGRPSAPTSTASRRARRSTPMVREAEALDLPPGYDYRKGFRSRSLDEVAVNFLLAFGLSLVFMYMVLAAQFESFTDPITILLALPLTFPFALLSLRLLGQPMDIYAIFGLFMLVGIVKKNGILQVDYTNELRRRGVPRDAAILEANRTRLRPILMTTLMLVAGMVPIALGRGPGSAARASLANVIIGGQMLSLLPTLLITPVAYALIDSLTSRWRRRSAARPLADEPLEVGHPAEADPQLVG